MTSQSLTFDAVAEARPGPKWCARWHRSWPAYETWIRPRGGDSGLAGRVRGGARRALMPVHRQLTRLAADGDGRRGSYLHELGAHAAEVSRKAMRPLRRRWSAAHGESDAAARRRAT